MDWLKFVVLADDLTGAIATGSVLCSLIGVGKIITLDFQKVNKELMNSFDCLCVNTGTREKSAVEVRRRLERSLEFFEKKCPYALRIDGLLRGPIKPEIECILEKNDVLLTDTVPEFGRFTESGIVKLTDGFINLVPLATNLRAYGENYGHKFVVADSKTYRDLERLAKVCITRGMVPVDPGPLIAYVAREVMLEQR